MSPKPPSPTALRVAELGQNAEHRFSLRPPAAEMAAIAQELGFVALRKVGFEGSLVPEGKTGWRLKARLGATVVQECVVTLDPVTTRIDTDVTRLFARDFTLPDEPEVEMPEDDTTEALGTWIDPASVMVEALSIAAPDYPRKDGAELGQKVYAAPGTAPMTDEDARPFAGLADFKEALKKDGE